MKIPQDFFDNLLLINIITLILKYTRNLEFAVLLEEIVKLFY